MRPSALALLGLLASGCAQPEYPRATCPAPYAADPTREARLRMLLERDHDARAAVSELPRACFGPAPALGVLAGGRPMLAAHSSDVALAARLAHLGVHAHDGLGDGCRLGRARALASEGRARALETRLRAQAGLGALDDDEASADYAARCAEP